MKKFAPLIFSLAAVLAYAERYMFVTLTPEIQTSLALSYKNAGFANAAFLFGSIPSALFFGSYRSQAARRWLPTIGILIAGIATVLCGSCTSMLAMVTARIGVGIGEGMFLPHAPAAISAAVQDAAASTRWLAVYTLCLPFGSSLGLLAGSQLGAAFGWRTAFLIAGAATLPLTMVIWFAHLRSSERTTPIVVPASVNGHSPKIPHVVLLMPLILGFASANFAIGGLLNWLPRYASNLWDADEAIASHYATATNLLASLLGAGIGVIYAPRWIRRSQTRAAYNVAGLYLLCAACFLIMPVAASLPLFMMLAGLALAASFATAAPVFSLVISTSAENAPFNIAILTVVAQLIGSLPAPVVVGWLFDVEMPRMALELLGLAAAAGALFVTIGGRRLVVR